MANSHYVPRMTLRRFWDKLCLFNVQTGEFKENVKIEKAFCEKEFYTDEIETKLNKKIESTFANLLNNKILRADQRIELKRDELLLIKKFLIISVIRSKGSEEFIQHEKHFYEDLDNLGKQYAQTHHLDYQKIEPPFQEKEIAGETSFDYWMRTINVILETDGSPEQILQHPDKTYPAHRWATVINNGYIAFWDSEFDHDEFVITDVGMTSENEKGWNGITNHNVKKSQFLFNLFQNAKTDSEQQSIARLIFMHNQFTENFMMFPISAKRMIVEIDPFYKFRIEASGLYKMPELDSLTMMPNENLFYPNQVKYVKPQNPLSLPIYDPNDLYIYDIKKLTAKETCYCNVLFMDRINTWLGFSSLNKAVKSIFSYKRMNSLPFVPRVDYTELYKIINKHYQSNIDIETIKGWRR